MSDKENNEISIHYEDGLLTICNEKFIESVGFVLDKEGIDDLILKLNEVRNLI